MRLTLVIPALGAGGAERVMITLANAWAERGWAITLLTYDDGRDPPFYPLHPIVTLQPLDVAQSSRTPLQAVRHNVWRLRALRRAFIASRPDVIVSFLSHTNVVALAASRGLAVPVIVSERVDPNHESLARVWSVLRRSLYPLAAAVVAQTAQAKAYFPSVVRRRTRIIPNPVPAPFRDRPSASSERPDHHRTLIAAGRLTRQKGFDLLLRAFAAISPRHPEWSLVIWGDGPLRSSLEGFSDDLRLRERVSFPGRTPTLPHEIAQADLFVLSSRYEGFPNVLCEAMACGVPVVSFDCPSGPSDILRHGIDGLLVPAGDTAALASALDRLMANPEERGQLAARAPEILDRFGLDRVLAEWDKLFTEVRR